MSVPEGLLGDLYMCVCSFGASWYVCGCGRLRVPTLLLFLP